MIWAIESLFSKPERDKKGNFERRFRAFHLAGIFKANVVVGFRKIYDQKYFRDIDFKFFRKTIRLLFLEPIYIVWKTRTRVSISWIYFSL